MTKKCTRCGRELELVEVDHWGRRYECMPGHSAPCGVPCATSGSFLIGTQWHGELVLAGLLRQRGEAGKLGLLALGLRHRSLAG